MQAPDNVKRLIELFDRNIFDFKNSAYKEAHVRQEFINPFWSALGWDMDNRAGLPIKLKEVIHEDRLEIEGNIKAPDYGFRKGEQTKFYLEVKAPRIYLKEDISPAFQIKSYAWSGGLPVSVLSDFEEFAVYQCTNRPKADDKTIKDRIAYFKYTDYIEKWEWLHETFSKQAVYDGRFDTFANTYAKKRGTQSFDKAFLADMHEWRTKLAQNIALRNPWIDERELNYAVQATLDRIIFLRIAEDRGIEKYGNLGVDAGLDYVLEAKSTKRRKVEGVYKTLLRRFKTADDRYNSGLFHFSKEKERGSHDTITPRLEIDDKVITKIIEELYYPESPYAFDQVPADVLGSVYEQFLGQVISLSPSHKASIDYKPEVKKAGGVYYTPKYIVDYIVKNTLGKLLDDIWPRGTGVPPVTPDGDNLSLRGGTTKQSPEEKHHLSSAEITKHHRRASALKVLDPACGSGSFLLGAYQYLLDWYHKFYTQTDPKHWVKQKAIEPLPSSLSLRGGTTKQSPEDEHRTPTQDYRLTQSERKRILFTHIHGVDIDSQAVEVAKLNLLLKASEGSGAQAQGQFTFDKNERLLPDLEKNIVCGNSLVEWDYFTDPKLKTEDHVREINPLDFTQVFPNAMSTGGFEVALGNPPYVMMQSLDTPSVFEHFKSRYASATYKVDTYQVFIERFLELVKPSGKIGLITPNSYLRNVHSRDLRKQLLDYSAIDSFLLFDYPVFKGAHVDTAVIIATKGQTATNEVQFVRATDIDTRSNIGSTIQEVWKSHPTFEFSPPTNLGESALLEKLNANRLRIGDFATA